MIKLTPEVVEAAERADISNLFKESWIAINELRKAAREQLGQQAAAPGVEQMRRALERARTVLGNMAEENAGSMFLRWPIHHEPLRADARNLLPAIDAALAVAPPPVRPAGLPWREVPATCDGAVPFDGRTHLVRCNPLAAVIRLAHWHENAWFVTDQGPRATLKEVTHYIARDTLLALSPPPVRGGSHTPGVIPEGEDAIDIEEREQRSRDRNW